MASKILNFIATSSERTRKAIAGIAVCLAGITLFFAWTAGVSARLPLLGSEFDTSTISQNQGQDSPDSAGAPAASPASATAHSAQAAVSPIQGLIASFQNLIRLFKDGSLAGGSATASSSIATDQAPSSPNRPIDVLFDKIGNETPTTTATTAATSTPTSSENLTPTQSAGAEPQPPIEDLPGI